MRVAEPWLDGVSPLGLRDQHDPQEGDTASIKAEFLELFRDPGTGDRRRSS
jgi:hypothetical protein